MTLTTILLCFFLSGFACLVYEVCWSRLAALVLGSSLHAVAVTTAVFMGALAAGALAGGSWADRRVGDAAGALSLYALFEALAAVWALAVPAVLFSTSSGVAARWLGAIAQGDVTAGYLLRAVVVVGAMAPPAALMGAVFPVLLRAFAGHKHLFQPAGLLYAVNTGGAVAGCVVSGFLLLPYAGTTVANASGAAMGLMAATLAWAGSRMVRRQQSPEGGARTHPEREHPAGSTGKGACGNDRQSSPEDADERHTAPVTSSQPAPGGPGPGTGAAQTAAQPHRERPGRRATPPGSLILLSAAAGACALALEVVWSRLFSLVLSSSIYSFTLVLAFVLLGIAAGSAVSTRLAMRISPMLLAAAALLLGATCLVATLYAVEELVWWFVFLQQKLVYLPGAPFSAALNARAAIIGLVTMPPAFFLGAIFPLLLAEARLDADNCARRVGVVYASNAAGGVGGALAAGYLLIPHLGVVSASGIQTTLIFIIVIMIALAVLYFWYWAAGFSQDRQTAGLLTAVAGFMALALLLDLVVFPPGWDRAVLSCGASFFAAGELSGVSRRDFMQAIKPPDNAREVVFYREGLNTTVTVEKDRARNLICLRTDGKVEGAVPLDRRRNAERSDRPTQLALGALPYAAHGGCPRAALLIGMGTGTTLNVLYSLPGIESVTVVDLEAAVMDAASLFPMDGISAGRKPAITDRVVDDARFFLAASAKRYDLIVSQPGDPWVPGSSRLFTREFWALARSRLNRGGVFCQWLQLYSVDPEDLATLINTFVFVFPEAHLVKLPGAGEVLLVARNGGIPAESHALSPRPLPVDIASWAGLLDDRRSPGYLELGPVEMQRLIRHLAGGKPPGVNTDDRLFTEFAMARLVCHPERFLAENVKAVEQAALHR